MGAGGREEAVGWSLGRPGVRGHSGAGRPGQWYPGPTRSREGPAKVVALALPSVAARQPIACLQVRGWW